MTKNAIQYVIADLHFGHKKVKEFRPFGEHDLHDAELIRRWNAIVRGKDIVWVLGDVAFTADAFKKLKLLNGHKKLILGNHDTYPSQRYTEVFEKVFGAMEMGSAILTHIPIHQSQFQRYSGNIHGHLHGDSLTDDRYVCVSAEQTDYQPMLMQRALELIG